MSGPEGFHCREPELSEQDEAGIMAAAVELGCFHWVDQANRALIAATREVHRLTLLLEEREATIAALLERPRLRIVDPEIEPWMEHAK